MIFKINLSKFMKIGFLSLVIFSFSILAIPNQNAFAIIPDWQKGAYTTNQGGVLGAGFPTDPVIVTVTDPDATGLGTITARITSSVDPVGFDLTLTEGTPGTFTNTNLALMSDNGIVTMQSTLRITIWDDSSPLPVVQTLPPPPIFIFSDSDTGPGLSPVFTETGPDTNLYEATINFGPTTNPQTDTLAASPGDIYTVVDLGAGNNANGFIIPNPNFGKGAIQTIVGETVTASYQGDSASFLVNPLPGPGRGTGGLIKPGLVVDTKNGGGGCSGCQPPTLGMDKNFNRVVNEGFSYNGNPVDVESYYTPYPLITVDVGQNNLAVLKIYDDEGIDQIKHVGLAFGLSEGQSFSQSKATISLDRTIDGQEVTDVYDPEHVLDNVEITSSMTTCGATLTSQCLLVSIQHIFREPLLFNMVGTNVWDFKRNSWQNFYNHGIEIEGNSLNPPKSKMVAFGEKEMRGLHQLIQVDKKKDLWVDEFGNIYEHKGNDRFDRTVNISKEIIYDKMKAHGCDRTCNWFNEYKLNEEILAKIKLSEMLGGQLIGEKPIKAAFSYTYNPTTRAENKELQKAIVVEKQRAEKLFDNLFVPHPYD